jgi:hypothetical protein
MTTVTQEPGQEAHCTRCNAVITVPATASETSVEQLIADFEESSKRQQSAAPEFLGTYAVGIVLVGAGVLLALLAMGFLVSSNGGAAMAAGISCLTMLALGVLLLRVRDIARHTWRPNVD